MRVLWFTNSPMPAVNHRAGRPDRGSGFWMSSMIQWLKARDDIQLAVVTAAPGYSDARFEEDGTDYFVVGQPGWLPIFAQRKRDIKRCSDILREWKPDLVHIHGTERFYGLLLSRGLIDTPTIISVQGLLRTIVPKFFGSLSLTQILRSVRLIELPLGYGLIWMRYHYKKSIPREADIIRAARAFTGQTDWDRAHVWSLNPKATYYRIGRVLRPPFYERTWDISTCNRHTIIFTNAGKPLRGVETLLESIDILRTQIPDIRLRLVGRVSARSGYGSFLRKRIDRLGLIPNVSLLGYLDAPEMGNELCLAHLYAIASHIENESNSLCEAMLVGMPCVASYVGGIPSMIKEGQTGLFFPAGDAAVLASRIRQIFADDDLTVRLGSAARVEAIKRHLPEQVIDQLLAAYKDVLRRSKLK